MIKKGLPCFLSNFVGTTGITHLKWESQILTQKNLHVFSALAGQQAEIKVISKKKN
jgi:hypothetical protein